MVAQMAAIFFASSMTAVPDMPAGLNNYTGHMIGYALLAALAFRAFGGATWRGLTMGAAWRAVVLASAYGVTDELHQRFVPGRTPDVYDWFADTAGAALGALLLLALARMVERRRDRTRSV